MVYFVFTYNVLPIVCARFINPLSANITKWSNTLKQFVGNLPTNCVTVFDHFLGLVLEELKGFQKSILSAKSSSTEQK